MKQMGISMVCAILPAALQLVAGSIEVSVDTTVRHQVIEQFAAADAWSANFVGKYFDECQKGQIARWLFSREIKPDGNPEGIGLSMWRVNLGGGTLEQDGANIMPVQRRAESYLTKDGSAYDWSKCAGHRYFMAKAREYGCNKFIFFSNTPLVQWTRNGQGYGEKNDPVANIRPDCYGKFANYLAEVTKHFKEKGYGIEYISPINEPQGSWDSNRQEGSRWRTQDMHRIFAELDKALTEHKLDDVKMLFGEAASLKYIYAGKGKDEFPYDLARKFFDPESPWSVRGLKHMPLLISGHSYHTEKNPKVLRETREKVAETCRKYGIDFQQTEWCFLPNFSSKTHSGFTDDWSDKSHSDLQVGLLLGRIIYSDFVFANSKSWGYWKGMEINGDYALTSLFPRNGDITQGGTVQANKLLWALGNFSLFVRPDYRRVAMSGADDLDKSAGVAFLSPDEKQLVLVFVNSGFDADEADIGLKGIDSSRIERVRAYRTDEKMDLGCIEVEDKPGFVLAPRSITTLVYDLK
ncbi:MAG: glycoside hydrolase [Kiritimatiellia bacterium]